MYNINFVFINNIHLHSIYFLTTLPHTFTIFFLLTLLHPRCHNTKFALSLGGVTSSGRLQPSVQHIMHKQSSGCQILHRFRPQVPPARQVFVQESLEVGVLLTNSSCTGFILTLLSCYPTKTTQLRWAVMIDDINWWQNERHNSMFIHHFE